MPDNPDSAVPPANVAPADSGHSHDFVAVGGEFPDTCRLCGCFRDSANHKGHSEFELALDYIETYAADIKIREQVDGKWRHYSLAEMPGHLAIKHAFRFLREGRIPRRIQRASADDTASGISKTDAEAPK